MERGEEEEAFTALTLQQLSLENLKVVACARGEGNSKERRRRQEVDNIRERCLRRGAGFGSVHTKLFSYAIPCDPFWLLT